MEQVVAYRVMDAIFPHVERFAKSLGGKAQNARSYVDVRYRSSGGIKIVQISLNRFGSLDIALLRNDGVLVSSACFCLPSDLHALDGAKLENTLLDLTRGNSHASRGSEDSAHERL